MASQSNFGDIATPSNERLFLPQASEVVPFDEVPACDLLTRDLSSGGPTNFWPFLAGYAYEDNELVGRPSSSRVWRSSGHITLGLPTCDQVPFSP